MGCPKHLYNPYQEPSPFLGVWKKERLENADAHFLGTLEEKSRAENFCDSYLPFGMSFNSSATSPENLYKYNGKEEQKETDWYDYGWRMYQPDLGRWFNVDPLSEDYLDFSPYHFSGNNPVRFVDVDGRYYVREDGERVEVSVNDDGQLVLGDNASADLIELVGHVNSSGSSDAINQIFDAGANDTKIHVKIETEVHDQPGQKGFGLLGVHQAHDKDGNILEWDSEKGDFNGVPAYVEGQEGVYAEATITIFKGNIEDSGGNGQYYGFDVTTDQEIANTFQHEANHDTDKEFIQNLRDRREGKTTKYVDPHQNIHPQEQRVYRQMQKKNRSKKKN